MTHLTHMPMFVGFPLILTTHNMTHVMTHVMTHTKTPFAPRRHDWRKLGAES